MFKKKRNKIETNENKITSNEKKENNSNFLYNKKLLELCLIDNKHCYGSDNYSNEQILEVILRCKEYLEQNYGYMMHLLPTIHERSEATTFQMEYIIGYYSQYNSLELIRPLSSRQIHCICAANRFIAEGNYNYALHEFSDAIDDYYKAVKFNKIISINEYGIYMCVLENFIYSLKKS